jgi:predicted metal-binding membrane protein
MALVFLVVAAIAWAVTIWQSRSTGGMGMGLGSLESFATSWAVMMAAMMLPSALPLVYEFARRLEGRRRWQAATGVLAATYLSIWLGFGFACYFVLNALPVPRTDQGPVGGVALALAGLYGLTPIKAASKARCRELCSLHGPLPFTLVRSALIAGTRYGLSCVGCSAGLMAAMALIGMSNLGWVVILAGLLLVYKLAPAPSMGRKWLLSVALIAMAVVYASMA